MRTEWKEKKLGDIATISYGYTAKAKHDIVGPRFLRITDIKYHGVSWDTVPFCQVNQKDHEKHRLRTGDIVFARTGATTGKSYLVNDPPDAVCASYLIRLSLHNGTVLPEFLILFFQTKQYWDAIKSGTSGSAQGGFNASKLSELSVLFPPLPEQKRIVAILDEVFEGITQAVANAEKNLVNARELFESYLDGVFTQKGEGWVEKKLEEECDIFMGQSPPGTSYNTSGEGVPLINGPVEFGGIDPFSKTVATKFTTKPTKMCKAGDLILCVRGSTTGRMNIAGQDACIGRGVAAIRSAHNQDWINQFISFSRGKIFAMGTGSTFPNVSASDLKNTVIPVPPKKQRRIVVEKIETLGSETQHLETIYQQKLTALSELKQSTLQKAFSGSLTGGR